MAGLSFNVHETINPLAAAAEAAVTLSTTNKALIPAARYLLGQQFFNIVGRKLRIHAHGTITTGTTPGNLTVAMLWGTGADANGTSLCATAALALTASQTNIPWVFEAYVRANALGATGTLLAVGELKVGNAVVAASLQPILLPAGAPTAVGSLDLTGTSIPSLQALRSGSTAETMTVHDYDISPMA